MRQLLTILFSACALNGLAQFEPQQYPFPYNPDYDGDGMVSMTDFLEILTLFGQEYPDSFYADSTRAVLNLGEMRGEQCLLQAEAAGSDWRVMRDIDIPYFAQLAVNSFPNCFSYEGWYWESNDNRLDACSWYGQLSAQDYLIPNADSSCYWTVAWEGNGSDYFGINTNRFCILVSEVKPEVEYGSCFSYDLGVMETCVATKLNDGWQPMPGGSSSSGFFQGFWRYEE